MSAFELPKGVVASLDRDFVVATLAGSSASASADAAADDAAAAASSTSE